MVCCAQLALGGVHEATAPIFLLLRQNCARASNSAIILSVLIIFAAFNKQGRNLWIDHGLWFLVTWWLLKSLDCIRPIIAIIHIISSNYCGVCQIGNQADRICLRMILMLIIVAWRFFLFLLHLNGGHVWLFSRFAMGFRVFFIVVSTRGKVLRCPT